ncbi:hypothetical protein HRH69_07340 [Enterococcus faecalis]|uniref:hypothetical protein n=1 Tax=Enterococcus faecalis TaxID=1351 RepID=UPI0011418218|nr:hypothetical protein [Enterococcus faecalis]NSW13761.1 hypothetical protein [Enterococcus faecalis]TQB25379.1 hypothetical protein FKZ16_09975 [Enterococcus faecalis]
MLQKIFFIIIFLCLCVAFEKIANRFFSIEEGLKADTKKLIGNEVFIVEYIKQWWFLYVVVVVLSSLATYLIYVYLLPIIAIGLILTLIIILFINRQEEIFKKNKVVATQLTEEIVDEVTNMFKMKEQVNIKYVDGNDKKGKFIYAYIIESTYFFDELKCEQFLYTLQKKFRDESRQMRWIDNEGNSTLFVFLNRKRSDEIEIIVVICSNDETRTALNQYYKHQKNNSKNQNIEDDDF